MHPRCKFDWDYCPTQTKKYQLVIMMEDGYTSFSGRLYNGNEIEEAVKEMRELYAKHGVTHHVGYREV